MKTGSASFDFRCKNLKIDANFVFTLKFYFISAVFFTFNTENIPLVALELASGWLTCGFVDKRDFISYGL